MKGFSTDHYQFINYNECSRADLLEIREIRNLPEVRARMVDEMEISLEQHLKFLESLKHNTSKDYFIIKDHAGHLIGSVNLTYLPDQVAERGLFINPSHFRQGHAFRTMKELYSRIAQTGIKSVFTKVKTDNNPSNNLEKKLGAELISSEGGYNNYLLQI